MMKYFFTLMFICGSCLVSAQRYAGEATLPPAAANGYHSIPITPNLAKFLTEDFANLRITDADGTEIPYVVDVTREYRFSAYEEYQIEEKVQVEKCCTRLVFANPDKRSINHIQLKARNADVYKKAMIQGSDDNKTWYGVKDWFMLKRFDNPSSTSEFRIIDFPLVDYKHLRMTISDSATAPLNIESVGFYRDSLAVEQYNPIENAEVTVNNLTAEKETRITIKLDTLQWIDQLRIRPSGLPLFKRHARAYEVVYTRNKKKRLIRHQLSLGECMLTNDMVSTIPVTDVRARELLIVVDNGDSPPLRLDAIEILQRARTLVAYLEKDKKYFVKIGFEETRKPVYDLALLRDKINGVLPVIQPGPVVQQQAQVVQGSRTFFSSAYMWAAIAGIIVLLGFLSVKMIREIK